MKGPEQQEAEHEVLKEVSGFSRHYMDQYHFSN